METRSARDICIREAVILCFLQCYANSPPVKGGVTGSTVIPGHKKVVEQLLYWQQLTMLL